MVGDGSWTNLIVDGVIAWVSMVEGPQVEPLTVMPEPQVMVQSA